MSENCICGMSFETVSGYEAHLINGEHLKRQKEQYEQSRREKHGEGVNIDEWEERKSGQ